MLQEIIEAVANNELSVQEGTEQIYQLFEEAPISGTCIQIVKECKRKANADIKAARVAIRAKDFTKARNLLEASKEELLSAKEAIQDAESSSVDVMLSFIKDIGKVFIEGIFIQNALEMLMSPSKYTAKQLVKPKNFVRNTKNFSTSATMKGYLAGGVVATAYTGSKQYIKDKIKGNKTSIKEAFNRVKQQSIRTINREVARINLVIKYCSEQERKSQ